MSGNKMLHLLKFFKNISLSHLIKTNSSDQKALLKIIASFYIYFLFENLLLLFTFNVY